MNKNSGFSLIELLVTIGISGIVILMISFIMSQGTTIYKGENEVIDIQGEMQIVRNQLSETLMGAKNIVIVEAGDDIVIYTGDVDKSTNKLVAETSGPSGTSKVTTERIITYVKSQNSLYISSTYDSATSEGSLISNYVTDMEISIDESCKKTTGAGALLEEYYVNPLSVQVSMKLEQGEHSSDLDMSVRTRNILTRVAFYKAGSRTTLLDNVTDESVYKVK